VAGGKNSLSFRSCPHIGKHGYEQYAVCGVLGAAGAHRNYIVGDKLDPREIKRGEVFTAK
jgi:hypothetical protein